MVCCGVSVLEKKTCAEGSCSAYRRYMCVFPASSPTLGSSNSGRAIWRGGGERKATRTRSDLRGCVQTSFCLHLRRSSSVRHRTLTLSYHTSSLATNDFSRLPCHLPVSSWCFVFHLFLTAVRHCLHLFFPTPAAPTLLNLLRGGRVGRVISQVPFSRLVFDETLFFP